MRPIDLVRDFILAYSRFGEYGDSFHLSGLAYQNQKLRK
jgi:hypothetical protein